MDTEARRLYFTSPGEVSIRRVATEPPAADELLVETLASGISPGTELLVYRGEFPDGMTVDATIDALDDEFSYPLPYGYAAVGVVADVGAAVDDEWMGQRVFAFEPHGDRFTADPDAVVPLRDGVSTTEATLLPSVETATNLVLDGAPRVGERAIVFGAGPVGLCTAHVLAGFPLTELVVVEPVETRQSLAEHAGADRVLHPDAVSGDLFDADPAGADLVYELSGQPETLDTAIEVVGYDGRIIVGSWYGKKRASLDLGRSFHRDRITIESSQVSTIDPSLRGRWDRARRFDVAFDHLRRFETDALLQETFPFADAAEAYRLLDDGAVKAPHVVLTY